MSETTTRSMLGLSPGDDGAIAELTDEQRRALPPEFHRPYWLGDASPPLWVCSACWTDDGSLSRWPCTVAGQHGRPLVAYLAAGTTGRRLVEQALHLRQNGERASAGTVAGLGENWADWDRRAEAWLREGR